MTNYKIPLSKAISKLNSLLMLDRKDIGVIYIFALLAGIVQLSLPLGIQSIINFLFAGTISTSIIVLIGLVVLAVFLNGLFQIKQLQIIEKVKQKLFVRYSMEYGDSLPNLNIEKLDKVYLPENVNHYFETVSLQKGLDKLLIALPAASIQVILGLILLAFYHPFFIAFGVLLLTIVFIIIRFTSPQGLETAMLASGYKYRVAAWLQEVARTVKTFKYTRGTSLHTQKTDLLTVNYLDARTRHFKILLTQFWSLVSFKVFITAAMLILGSYLVSNQQINIGQFIAADIVIIAIIASIEKLITNIDAVYDAIVSVEKLSTITEAEKEKSGSLLLPPTEDGVAIEFKEVSYTYGDGTYVFKDINLDIPRGHLVQITGESGVGKSTLLRLITGAFTAFKGTILIDNIPVSNYNLQSLRQQTGILLGSQDIFHGTLWENLTMGDKDISLEQILTLAELTGLNEFIQSNKQGFDTILEPAGNKLSNNVRKNILLIRALAGNQKLLLLNEPFGHLKYPYKKNIIQYIKKAKKATVLITSQDESLSSFCDQVFTMNKTDEVNKV